MPAFFLVALIIVLLPAASASAQSPVIDSARMQTAVKQSWTQAPPEWQTRLTQDETMAACSQYRNNPPRAVAEAIVAREKASIKYPADGKLMGDWKKGQRLPSRDTAAGSPTIRRGPRMVGTATPAISSPVGS